MQTKFRFRLLIAGMAVLILASCGKSNKQGIMVPKEAAAVMHINGQSLLTKLPWDEIKKLDAFQDMMKDSTAPPFIRSIVENPENSGMDVKNDIMIYAVKDSSGSYVAVQGFIKDAAKFSTFCTLATGGGSSFEKEGVTYITKAPACVGWNKEKFVFLMDAPEFAGMGMYNFGGRNRNSERYRDVAATCKSLFDLKEGKSLAKESKFSDLMEEKGDLHFWVNTNEMMKGAAMGMVSLMKAEELYKDSYTTGTLNFENGKIDFGFKGYAGEKLTALYKKYSADGISTDMVKRFPGKDITGILAINYKPEFMREMIKLTGTDGFVNLGLAKANTGLTIDDLIKAQKGDVMIAAGNFRMKTDTVRWGLNNESFYINEQPEADFVFSASINDKAAFSNIIKSVQNLDNERRSYMDTTKAASPVSYNTNDKYFALGSNKQLVDSYLGGGNNDYAFMKKLSGYPIAGYFNLASFINTVSQGKKEQDSSKIEIMNLNKKVWQDVYLTGGKMEGGALTQKFELNMVDKNTNSLKQLVNLIAQIQEIEKRETEKMMEKYKIDNPPHVIEEEKVEPVVPAPPISKHK